MGIRVLSSGSTGKFTRVLLFCFVIGTISLPFEPSVAQDCSCGAPCYLVLENESLFGIEDLIACLTIEVGPNVTIEESADVRLSAGESIIVNNEVLVNQSASVAVEIDPLLFCDLTADLDNDQSDACLDCNDDDSSVYPGAVETCDGLDNDCDSLTDEGTCDDGLFCNGTEICSPPDGCLAGPPPCPGPDGDGDCAESCDENGRNCTANDPDASGCDDGDPCTFDDVCQSGSCAGMPIIDEYEGNDTLAAARILGSIEDGDEFPAGTVMASLYEAGDVDWYKFYVADTLPGSNQPKVELTNIPTGSDYQLCIYFKCDDPGSSQGVECSQGHAASYGGLPGCCSSNSGSQSERAAFIPECDNNTIEPDDKSGWTYIRVYNASPTWNCNNYSMPWGDD